LSDLGEDIINLKKLIKKGDWILVKGSRRMGMEKITSRICDDFGCETIK
jgi:UDP-N-acetylmuramyl pentapeptide synthase